MWCVFSHTIGTKPALACLNIVSVLQAQSLCITHPSVDTVTLVNGLWKRGSLCCGKHHYLWEYTRQSPLRIYLLWSKMKVHWRINASLCIYLFQVEYTKFCVRYTWIVLKTFRFLEKISWCHWTAKLFFMTPWSFSYRYHDWLVIYVEIFKLGWSCLLMIEDST